MNKRELAPKLFIYFQKILPARWVGQLTTLTTIRVLESERGNDIFFTEFEPAAAGLATR